MLMLAKEFEKLWESFQAQAEIRPASDFDMQVAAIRDGKLKGTKIEFFGDREFQVRFGELTIIAGPSGHGKSLLTGQLALEFAKKEQSSCIMSFEMTPARTIDRMLSQCVGRAASTDDALAALQYLGKRIFVLDKVGSVSQQFVYGAIIDACKNHGCKHIFVDNLMKCCDEFGDAGMNGTKNFVATLCELAKQFKCHVWLVHHVRKSEKETDKVDKYSIRGAAVVTDQADNIIILQRNSVKEKDFDEKGFDQRTDETEPDSTLTIAKQRNGSYQGRIPLWFSPNFMAFCTDSKREVNLIF